MESARLPLNLLLGTTIVAGTTLLTTHESRAASLFVGSFNTNSVLQFDADTGAALLNKGMNLCWNRHFSKLEVVE